MRLKLALFLAFIVFNGIQADCGCNKLKRGSENLERSESVQYNVKSPSENQWPDETPISGMSLIPGGKYTIGTSEPIFHADQESPEKIVEIGDFYLDKHEVSNDNFREFVDATGYITEAERFNDSFVFGEFLSESVREEFHDYRVVQAPWWYKVTGVNWRHPQGPDSSLEGKYNLALSR